jgi:hypothetical protein
MISDTTPRESPKVQKNQLRVRGGAGKETEPMGRLDSDHRVGDGRWECVCGTTCWGPEEVIL